MLEHVKNSSTIQTLGILLNILLIIQHQLTLKLQRALKSAVFNKQGNNLRHATLCAVVHEQIVYTFI